MCIRDSYTEDRERRMIFSASSLCEISTTLNVRLDDTRYAYEAVSYTHLDVYKRQS